MNCREFCCNTPDRPARDNVWKCICLNFCSCNSVNFHYGQTYLEFIYINVLWSAGYKGLLWNPNRVGTLFRRFGCSLSSQDWGFRRHRWQPLFGQYTSSSLADAEFGVCRCSIGIKWSQKGWISSKNGNWRDETFSRGDCRAKFPSQRHRTGGDSGWSRGSSVL